MRLTLGGGGTDLKSYYCKYGGFLISAAIDKYVFIAANKRFYDNIRLSYSKTEIVDDVGSIEHSIFREALKLLGFNGGIEIVSIGDMPANSGLGSSSSFTVSLLNALHAYKRDFVTQRQLAEEACHIEIDILKEPIGKQDQYASALGCITCLTFKRDGEVIAEPIKMSVENIDRLRNSIVMFHTGIERKASDVLSEQNKKAQDNDTKVIEALHKIKEIGLESRKTLELGRLDDFGNLLDIHWQTKKNLSNKVSVPFIDECYDLAKKNGALGGKVIGAGGGGVFMFYCRDNDKPKLFKAMQGKGLKPVRYEFDFEGAKILVNMKKE